MSSLLVAPTSHQWLPGSANNVHPLLHLVVPYICCTLQYTRIYVQLSTQCFTKVHLTLHCVVDCTYLCIALLTSVQCPCPKSPMLHLVAHFNAKDPPDLYCIVSFGRGLVCPMALVELDDHWSNTGISLSSPLSPSGYPSIQLGINTLWLIDWLILSILFDMFR